MSNRKTEKFFKLHMKEVLTEIITLQKCSKRGILHILTGGVREGKT
jgi:hypothetical protein